MGATRPSRPAVHHAGFAGRGAWQIERVQCCPACTEGFELREPDDEIAIPPWHQFRTIGPSTRTALDEITTRHRENVPLRTRAREDATG